MSATHALILHTAESVSDLDAGQNAIVDLSVVCIKMQLEAMHTSNIAERSRVQYMKTSGPSTEPWGTPNLSRASPDDLPDK